MFAPPIDRFERIDLRSCVSLRKLEGELCLIRFAVVYRPVAYGRPVGSSACPASMNRGREVV